MRYSKSSGEQTSSAAVYSDHCYMTGCQVITDGTNDATLIIKDATSDTGTVVLEMTVKGSNNYGGRNWTYPIRMDDGIYGKISGTGASFIIEYIGN